MKALKYALAAVLFVLLVACGGGGGGGGTTSGGTTSGGTTSGGTTSGGTTSGGTTPSPTNTPVVLNYIDVRHSSVQSAFLTGEDAINRSLAASGMYQSGAHYTRSGDNYVSMVQSFLDDSVTYSRSLNASFPVDSASVATLLRSYKTQDANYVTTYYGSVNWGLSGSSLTSFINSTQARINSTYDAAIANLP